MSSERQSEAKTDGHAKFESAIDHIAAHFDEIDILIVSTLGKRVSVLHEREKRTLSELSEARSKASKIYHAYSYMPISLHEIKREMRSFQEMSKVGTVNKLRLHPCVNIFRQLNVIIKLSLQKPVEPMKFNLAIANMQSTVTDATPEGRDIEKRLASVTYGLQHITRNVNSVTLLKESLRTPSVQSLTSIAVHPISKHLYVTDEDSKKILIFSNDLSKVSEIDFSEVARNWIQKREKGSSRISSFFRKPKHTDTPVHNAVCFFSPTFLAISKDGGRLALVDKNRHLVVVVNEPDAVHAVIGTSAEGHQNNELCFPTSAAFDSHGMIYVADTENRRIQKFDRDGKYQMTIGKALGMDTSQAEYKYHGLVINKSDELYVTAQCEGLVLVYSVNGELLRTISVQPRSSPLIGLRSPNEFFIFELNSQRFSFYKDCGDLIKDVSLNWTSGIVFGDDDCLYALVAGRNTVRKFKVMFQPDSIEFPIVNINQNREGKKLFGRINHIAMNPKTRELYITLFSSTSIYVLHENGRDVSRLIETRGWISQRAECLKISFSVDGQMAVISGIYSESFALIDHEDRLIRKVERSAIAVQNVDINHVFCGEGNLFITSLSNSDLWKMDCKGNVLMKLNDVVSQPRQQMIACLALDSLGSLALYRKGTGFISIRSTRDFSLIRTIDVEGFEPSYLTRGPFGAFVMCDHASSHSTRSSIRFISAGGVVEKIMEEGDPSECLFDSNGRFIVLSRARSTLYTY